MLLICTKCQMRQPKHEAVFSKSLGFVCRTKKCRGAVVACGILPTPDKEARIKKRKKVKK